MKRRNLSDKRSKRKIVAENRALHGQVLVLTCAVQVGQILLQVMQSQPRDKGTFSEGGIVVEPFEGEVRAGEEIIFPLSANMIDKITRDIAKGKDTLLPDHEANQKKETR